MWLPKGEKKRKEKKNANSPESLCFALKPDLFFLPHFLNSPCFRNSAIKFLLNRDLHSKCRAPSEIVSC